MHFGALYLGNYACQWKEILYASNTSDEEKSCARKFWSNAETSNSHLLSAHALSTKKLQCLCTSCQRVLVCISNGRVAQPACSHIFREYLYAVASLKVFVCDNRLFQIVKCFFIFFSFFCFSSKLICLLHEYEKCSWRTLRETLESYIFQTHR